MHIFVAKYLLFVPLFFHVFGVFISLPALKLDFCHHKYSGVYFDEHHGHLHIESDDIFRMSMLCALVIGFRLTRSHLLNDLFFSFTQNLHLLLAILFICDLFRPKPAPHNKVGFIYFPGFFFWVLSKCLYYYEMYISSQRLIVVKRVPFNESNVVALPEPCTTSTEYRLHG